MQYMSSKRSTLVVVGGIALLSPSIYVGFTLTNETVRVGLIHRACIGFMAFLTSVIFIPKIAVYTEKKGLFGKDLGKRYIPELRDVKVPEALGIVSAITFLVCIILEQVMFAENIEDKANYNSALTSVCFMVLLGFMDDVLDLPWRAKLFLPTIASFPLLSTYTGSTSIVVPIPLRPLLVDSSIPAKLKLSTLTTLGTLLDHLPSVVVDRKAGGAIIELGVFYLVYMSMLSVFCTNAINIYAGINGLEAGQAVVIGCGILLYGLLQIQLGSHDMEQYYLAVTLVIPFIGTALGLLWHNWFPSKVFVGDTFCYFAGMTFAVIGIHGHFTKPLLLFFLPQVANFIYSVPQLFKIVPCPRHRLPCVDEHRGNGLLMIPSTFPCKPEQYKIFKRLHFLPPNATELPNFTIINLVLRMLGPTSERDLCLVLLLIQAFTCGLAIWIRYSSVASYLFDG